MGWTSTGDPYANVGDSALCFDSVEAAKKFAEKHGWDYVVSFLCRHFTSIVYNFIPKGRFRCFSLRYFLVRLFLSSSVHICNALTLSWLLLIWIQTVYLLYVF